MRRSTKRHIGRLAIASLFLRVMLLAVFAPLTPAPTTAHAQQTLTADGTPLTTVLCSTHGTMTIPAADLGLDPQADKSKTSQSHETGHASGAPHFCPFCLTLIAKLPASSSNGAIWAPLIQPIFHARHHVRYRHESPRRRIAQPRAPPSPHTSRV
ncbi:MAG: DUF2946 family protein [Pseudomonadota bacterium]